MIEIKRKCGPVIIPNDKVEEIAFCKAEVYGKPHSVTVTVTTSTGKIYTAYGGDDEKEAKKVLNELINSLEGSKGKAKKESK